MKQIFHRWEKWECYKAGFYKTAAAWGEEKEAAKKKYADFLSDLDRFERALNRVLHEWPISCEHFLSNENINRIAWLGQSSMCIDTGTPHIFKSGFFLLTERQQKQANAMARKYLTIWQRQHAEKDQALSQDMGSPRLL